MDVLYFTYRSSDTGPIPSVTHQMCDDRFDREIDIPDTVTHLIFGDYYNQPVILPPLHILLLVGIMINQQIYHPPLPPYIWSSL